MPKGRGRGSPKGLPRLFYAPVVHYWLCFDTLIGSRLRLLRRSLPVFALFLAGTFCGHASSAGCPYLNVAPPGAATQTGTLPASTQATTPADQEKAVRARVESFYTLLQTGKLLQADAYVTEGSRERFRDQGFRPILSFEIQSVKLDPSGKAATAAILVESMSALMASPVQRVETLQCQLVDGVWYVEIPKASETTLGTPFTTMPSHAGSPATPAKEELKLKGHTYLLGKVYTGHTKTARFPFTNTTDHVVTISKLDPGSECLKVRALKKSYQPGESGEVVVDFDPGNRLLDFSQTMVLTTDPGGIITYLTVKAYIITPPTPAAQSKGENSPDKKL